MTIHRYMPAMLMKELNSSHQATNNITSAQLFDKYNEYYDFGCSDQYLYSANTTDPVNSSEIK